MKSSKFVIALASILLLASCGAPHETGLSTSEPASSSQAKETMNFIPDGKFYVDVPADVLERVDGVKPDFRINGTAVEGSFYGNIGNKFSIEVVGAVAKDIYVSVATSTGNGHISAHAYGAVEKANVNEGLARIAEAIGTPNKVFLAFSTKKATWPKGADAEMDAEIQAAWDLVE